jgi:hypothetical protein
VRSRVIFGLLAGLLAVACCGAATAGAHPIGQSTIELERRPGRVDGILTMPATRLDLVLGMRLAGDGVSVPGMALSESDADTVAEYVAPRVKVTSEAGAPWALQWSDPELVDVGGLAQVRLSFEAAPPAGAAVPAGAAPADAAPAGVRLRVDAITEEVRTHDVIVTVRATDTSTGAEKITLAGIADFDSPELTVNFGTAAARAGSGRTSGTRTSVGRFASLGFEHFWAGADHVLFIVLLTFGAAAVGSVGTPTRRGWRSFVPHLIATSAMFTLGHGISLVLAARFGVTAPGAVVESAIAATILVSAAVVWNTLRAPGTRAEMVGAGIFGLIHGFGLSSALATAGVAASASWSSIAGFNLGLEAAQLTAILALVPALAVLGRGAAGATGPARSALALRRAVGAVGMVAGTFWLVQRAFRVENRLTQAVDAATSRPGLLLGAASVASVAVLVRALLVRGPLAHPALEPRPEQGEEREEHGGDPERNQVVATA